MIGQREQEHLAAEPLHAKPKEGDPTLCGSVDGAAMWTNVAADVTCGWCASVIWQLNSAHRRFELQHRSARARAHKGCGYCSPSAAVGAGTFTCDRCGQDPRNVGVPLVEWVPSGPASLVCEPCSRRRLCLEHRRRVRLEIVRVGADPAAMLQSFAAMATGLEAVLAKLLALPKTPIPKVVTHARDGRAPGALCGSDATPWTWIADWVSCPRCRHLAGLETLPLAEVA